MSTFVAEDADRLRSEHEELQKKYKLVSDLLTAKPNEHVEFKQFETLLNGEFREFADAESSLAEEGFTPLHAAVLSNACEVAEVLLKNGADLSASDSIGFFGKSPINYADGKTAKLLRRYAGE